MTSIFTLIHTAARSVATCGVGHQCATSPWRLQLVSGMLALLMLATVPAQVQAQQAQSQTEAAVQTTLSGPIRLRQPAPQDNRQANDSTIRGNPLPPLERPLRPAGLSDFERYARRVSGEDDLRRYGYDLIARLQSLDDRLEGTNASVPPDYQVRSGDELLVTFWGSVDADLTLQVDRGGRITIPRVGPIMVAGVRYGDLADTITRRVGQVFKNFQVSVSLGQIRGLRVYVTGFVNQPGPVLVGGLATLTQALLRAGGPAAGGSFREVQLRRGKQLVGRLDLYDLLLNGDRSADLALQSDDVIHVGPTGPQVAVVGSVNRQAVFETRVGETVEQVLRMAGGFNAVADASRVTLQRLVDGDRMVQVEVAALGQTPLRNGDVVRAMNSADVLRPMGMQQKRVRIEGEVQRPGEYLLPPAATVADAIRAGGGITKSGYLYAVEFTRESVRMTQQTNYDRALRDFETLLTTSAATRRTTSADEAAAQTAAGVSNSRLLAQLRELKPSGRIVLNVGASAADASALPDLVLEDGDRLFVPARPIIVGVFGSVYSTGSYLHAPNRTLDDYLRLAGGPTKGADGGSVFVVRANGTVVSSLQQKQSFFARGNQIASLQIEPGDTIFVPEEMDKSTFMQGAKDWTQIIYQLGLGFAGIASAIK